MRRLRPNAYRLFSAHKHFYSLGLLMLGLTLILAGVLALSSCSDVLQPEESDPEETNRTAIGFTTSVVETDLMSRGTPVTSPTNLTSMGVFCYHTGFSSWATVGTSTAPNKMNHLEFTQGTPNVWSTTSPVSWGSDVSIAEKFTFWAYAPYATGNGATGNGLTLNAPAGGKGFPTLTYTVPTDITKQPDLMITTTKDIHPTTKKVPLAYKHALTCIAFKAKGTGQTITAVKVKGVAASGTLSVDASGNPAWSSLSAPGTIEYTAGLNSTTGIVTGSTPTDVLSADGYLMMIPQTLTTNAQLIVTVDGLDQTFNLNAQTITTWTAGQQLTYTIETKPPRVIVDYTNLKASNSYILNPNSSSDMVYRFPVKRVNEFWADADNTYGSNDAAYALGATDAWTIKLVWNTASGSIAESASTDRLFISKASGIGPDDYFEVTVPKGYLWKTQDTNFLVSIHKGGGYYPSWSWHLWVTPYNPYGTATVLENASDNGEPWVWSVPGGKLFKLKETTPVLAKRVMDRPIGGTGGYTLCYQYGRKDPIPSPGSYSSVNDVHIYRYAATGWVYQRSGTMTLAEAVRTPHGMNSNTTWSSGSSAYIIGSKTWCSTTTNGINSNNAFLWHDPKVAVGSGGKSIFDPSPYGFRLPENGTFRAVFAAGSVYKGDGWYISGLFYTRSAVPYTQALRFAGGFLISSSYYSQYNICGYTGLTFLSSTPAPSDTNNDYGYGFSISTAAYLVNKSGAYNVLCVEE